MLTHSVLSIQELNVLGLNGSVSTSLLNDFSVEAVDDNASSVCSSSSTSAKHGLYPGVDEEEEDDMLDEKLIADLFFDQTQV